MLRSLHSIFSVIILILVLSFNAIAQNSVGIGTENPNENAVLELVSTNSDQGLLVPKLTTSQRTSPSFLSRLTSNENGLLVFDSDDNLFYYWQDTQWQEMGASISLLAGVGIDITGNVISNLGDSDADAQNEIQDLQSVLVQGNDAGGVVISNLSDPAQAQDAATKAYVDGSIVADSDGDPTNEIQDLSILSNILALTGSAVTVDLSTYLDNSDSQDALNVPVVPVGNLTSTNVQAAVEELQADIDLDLDNDPLNEIQDISIAGNTVGIDGGGLGFDLTPLAPAANQVLKWDGIQWVAGSDDTGVGTLPALADAQILTNNGSNVAVTVSGDVNMDNTGNMTVQSDAVTTIEILDGTLTDQDIDLAANISSSKLQSNVMLVGEDISLFNNDIGYLNANPDPDPTNEIQDLSIVSDIISLSNSVATIDLSSYLDNTDAQIAASVPFTPAGTIASTNVQAALEELDSDNTADTDSDPTNEYQDLSIASDIISLSNSVATVDLSSYLDNTDNQDIVSVLGVGNNAGGANLTDLGSLTTSAFQLGVANPLGYVLTADVSGNGTWQAIPAAFATVNEVPRGDGSGLVSSNIFSDGTNIGIGAAPGVYKTLIANPDNATALRLQNNNGTNFLRTLSLTTFAVGTMGRQGIYNQVLEPAGDANGSTAIRNDMTPQGTGEAYSIYNQITGAGSGRRFGILNNVNAIAGNTSEIYGERSNVRHDGSGDSYGNYITQLGVGSGIKYGIYATGEDVNYFSGDVGIGTSTPVTKLEVNGTLRTSGFQLGTTATAGEVLTADASGVGTWAAIPSSFILNNEIPRGDGSGMVSSNIYSNGTEIGIGTNSPFYLLDISSSTLGTAVNIVNNHSGAITKRTLALTSSSVGTFSKQGIYNQVNGTPANANGITGVRNDIVPNGTGSAFGVYNDIAIVGTGDRMGTLHNIRASALSGSFIYGTRANITHDGTGESYGSYVNHLGSGSGTKYGFYTQGEDVNYFSGRLGVGVGSTNPNYALQIASNTAVADLQIGNSTAGNLVGDGLLMTMSNLDATLINRENGNMSLGSNGSASMHLDPNGNVGIGIASPTAGIHSTSNNGALFEGNLSSGSIPTVGAGVRMMWYPGKAAFRAGQDFNGFFWTDANTGNFSVAMGSNTVASGIGSVALGSSGVSSGDYSFTGGQLNNALGLNSVAMGYNNDANLEASVALGYANTATGARSYAIGNGNSSTNSFSTTMGFGNNSTGDGAVAIGYRTDAGGDQSFSFGMDINSTASQSMVIGAGVNSLNKIINNTSNSLMVGFNSTIPTFYVGPGSGIGTTGNVGIGTSTPKGNFEVVGSQYASVRNVVISAGAFSVNSDDFIISVTTGGGLGSNVTLPDANTNVGRILIIRVRGTQPLNIVRSGSDLIEGAISYLIQDLIVDDVNGVTIVSVGSGDWIITQTSIR